MKQAAIFIGVLALSTLVLGQTPAQPAGQAPPATTPAQPPAKRPPQAKTQPEYDAYNAAKASANDPAAMEKAADDFAAKFPDSELRVLL